MKKTISVCYAVGNFPYFSETFVLRLIEGVHESGEVQCSIAVSNSYSPKQLEISSPIIKKGINTKDIFLSAQQQRKTRITEAKKYLLAAPILIKKPATAFRLYFHKKIPFKTILKGALFSKIFNNLPDQNIIHSQFLSISVYSNIAAEFNPRINLCSQISSIRGADITNKRAVSDHELEYLASTSTRYLCVSNSLKEHAILRGIPREKLSILYSGLDTSKISYSRPQKSIEHTSSTFTFLQVGRLVQKKGIHLSLGLIKSLVEAGIKVKLVVIGEGPLNSTLQSQAANLSIHDKIHFLGALANKEVLQWMRDSDFLLVPSMTGEDGDKEGIPNIAKEAMLCGCLVISSDHSGLPEIVIDRETGFLFKEGDEKSFYETTINAINSKHLWHEIANNARAKIKSEFDTKAISDKLLSIYSSLK